MIRCGVYLRQSEDAEGNELATSRQWDEIIEKIITPRGWEPVRYADNDRTAVGEKRSLPERDRMLRDIESGDLQAIAVWDCDRLYREPVDLERIISLADKHHTLLATVTGDVDLGTDNGRLFARIKGAVAKAETERRSVRQKAKYRQLAEAGENLSHRRSFGRLDDGSLHPMEAPALAEAYELVLAGHSVTSILSDWNRRKLRTSLGNAWRSPTQLTTILRNPRNAGLKSYNGVVLGMDPGWDPIVPIDVWKAVGDILTDPSRRPVDVARKHQLTGIMRCGECVALKADPIGRMRPSKTSAKVSPSPIYQCRECFRTRVLMSEADDHVIGLTVARLSRPDAAELLIDQKAPDLEAKRIEADALRVRLKTQAILFADGEIDAEQLKVGTARMKSNLKAIEDAIEDANRSRLFKGIVGKDAKKFPGLHLDRRRAVIDALMTLTLERRSMRRPFDPESIVVDWRA
jgi:DNA invertase Pin-like site-specific DNA recombinase